MHFPNDEAKLAFLGARIIGSVSSIPLRESNVVTIRAEAEFPNGAMTIANATAQVLHDRNVTLKRNQAISIRKLIEEQLLPIVTNEVKQADENMMAYKAKNKVISLQQQDDALGGQSPTL